MHAGYESGMDRMRSSSPDDLGSSHVTSFPKVLSAPLMLGNAHLGGSFGLSGGGNVALQ